MPSHSRQYGNLFNANDVLRFSDGTTAIVVSGPSGPPEEK